MAGKELFSLRSVRRPVRCENEQDETETEEGQGRIEGEGSYAKGRKRD